MWTNVAYLQHILLCAEWQTYSCQTAKLLNLIQSVTDKYPGLLDDMRSFSQNTITNMITSEHRVRILRL